MIVWTRVHHYEQDPHRPLILALGNFDGVHLGHQQILKSVARQAKKRGGIPAVLTFSEHPQRVLHQTGKPPLLTSPQHRLFLFEEQSVEVCFLIHFTLALSKVTPERFVEEWLVKQLAVKEVHLGYNAHFGSGRSGDCRLMKKLAGPLGFDFYEVEPVKIGGEFVSSSLIRQAVQQGDLSRAAECLGRPFTLFASVVRGKGWGRKLGYPTANLKAHSEVFPPRGVYPVEVRERSFRLRPAETKDKFNYEIDAAREWRRGILNYGIRPTFSSGSAAEVAEVFLFNFKGDLYGKTLEVRFYSRLREEKEFRSSEELVKAIQQDVSNAEQFFKSRKGNSLQTSLGQLYWGRK